MQKMSTVTLYSCQVLSSQQHNGTLNTTRGGVSQAFKKSKRLLLLVRKKRKLHIYFHSFQKALMLKFNINP